MKKIFLFMLPIMALSLTSCEKNNGNEEELSGDEIIEFRDPNFLKALLTVQEIQLYNQETGQKDIPYLMDVDENKDGAITIDEARKVRGLELYDNKNYASFNVSEIPEIKYFTALEYLDCGWNQLTSLDVSSNTALIYLCCATNERLMSLNVSNNMVLERLECHNNQLTTLDVSNNTALTYLLCNNNQLTSLDVSRNTALMYLGVGYNQLASLGVSNNVALASLDCSSNQLTSLDVSNNTSLISLDCSSNQLTSLDVHYNRSLTGLSCYNNPLQKLILYTYHTIHERYMSSLESEYGDIIEYME